MINRYTDHSANERTYLAWIRTAIAIMTFGFLIEKFDLFVSYLGKRIGNETHFQASISAEIVGLALIVVGILIIISATTRFLMFRNAIESDKQFPYSANKTNLALSFLMLLLAVFLLAYLGHLVVDKYS